MTHQEVIELLPWYLNATLSEGERREIGAHLAGCALCRGELEEMTLLQQAVVESAADLPVPSPSRLKEAMARIDSFEHARRPVRTPWVSWWSGIKERAADLLLGWAGPMPSFARALVTAQFLLIAGLAGGLGYSLWQQQEYATLSGTSQSGGEARLAVRFNEAATEAQLRELLRDIGGKIVDGPSSLGIYTVEVPIAPEKSAELEQLLQTLRARQELVAYVEKSG